MKKRNVLMGLMMMIVALLVSMTTKVRAAFDRQQQVKAFSWVWQQGRFVRYELSRKIQKGMMFIHVHSGEHIARSMYRCVDRHGETVSVSQSLDNFEIDLDRLELVSKIEDGEIVAYLDPVEAGYIDHFERDTWPLDAVTPASEFALAI